jgi:dipeptidyl aminopeptidase/acylaminoacyl peptidase
MSTGRDTSIQGVASFSFSPDGEWLITRPQGAGAAPAGEAGGGRGGRGGGAPAGGATAGTDLVMRNLTTGKQRYIGNVAQSAFDDAGKLFAYTVNGQQRFGNAVYVLTLATGEEHMLDAAPLDYDQLTWSAEGTNLAVLRGDKARDKRQKDNAVLAWTGVGTAQQKAFTLDPAKASAFPKGMVVSEYGALRWSPDGSRILVAIKEQEAERPAANANEPQANVDVWHWKDADPQSVQIVRLNQDLRSTFSAVYDLAANSVSQFADSGMRQVTVTDDLRWGIGRFDKPYRGQVAWGGSYGDYYKVNLSSGERTLVEPKLSRTMGFSPDDKYYLYLKAGHVYSYEMATGKKTQIDGSKSFVDATDDHDYEVPVYGVAGWSADNKSVLLYDRYDVWQVPLAGGPLVNLTRGEGAKDQVRFRIANLGAGGGGRGGRGGGRGGGGGQEPVDLSKPVTLSAYGDFNKKSGYFTLEPGKSPAPIIWEDRAVGSPTVARNADRMVFTQSTFTQYPDLWLSDKKFAAPRKVTDAYPEIREFAWSSGTKLIDYKNRFGQKLQATLTLPANYEPGKKYPMLVYFYELMSNTHHNFSLPTYDDRPHISTYASNGYMVLRPDVVYEIGKPGTSALDCVTAAVKEAIRLGYADPKRIGLQGHSWGGYQSSFIVTQTDLFAAVVTGAPPTDLTSFYGTLYRSTGTIQQGITEVGQVRMGDGATPWSEHVLYESQSPVHNAPNIKTPFMILHGTADGAVDWMQGLEFYAAARRLGKQVILLSYPDEPHHLGRRENQKDFQIRMKQFFDHYLQDTPAPQWMTDGVPQVRKGLDPTIIAPTTPIRQN